MRCRMHYRENLRGICPHGQTGLIRLTHRGKRLVRLDGGRVIVCPMWNAVPTRRGSARTRAHA